MKAALSAYPQYRKWFFAGLLVQVIAAWFSVGYNHPDEQFQVLELCNYKLGYSPATDLPWEFFAKCRAGLQPFMAYSVCRLLLAVNSYNPFTVAFLLRLFTGVLTWWASLRLMVLLLPQFVTDRGRDLFVYSAFLLWFVPYIGVRFSADNISGVFFFLALSYLLPAGASGLRRNAHLLFAGLLLGFSFSFRLQMAFALLGLGIWLLFIHKLPWKGIALLCLGGIAAIGISALADRWLYGAWVFTPFHYYEVNIIQKKAAQWGSFPWYYYITEFIQVAVPPISLVLLPLFLFGIFKKPRSVFSLVCLTFLAGHLFIDHKELRFLFPIMFAFIFLAFAGLDEWLRSHAWTVWYTRLYRVLAVFNTGLLLVKLFTPAQEVVLYYHYIYNYAQRQHTTLIAFKESPYKVVGIEMNFYKPRNMGIKVLDTAAQLPAALQAASGNAVLYLSPTLKPGSELQGYRTEQLYSLFPSWLLQYNINNWQDRSRIWTVLRVYPR